MCLSEEIGKDEDGNDSPAESARVIITHHIKGIEDISLDQYQNDVNAENEECDMDITDCNIASWSCNLFEECHKTVAKSIKCDMANPYYAPQLNKKLKILFSYFPLYSGIMITIFGYGEINASSSAVESEMKDVKHILLKNFSHSMRADKFITTHLNSFIGRSLLAMSTRNELSYTADNEQITGNNAINISINKTESTASSISKNYLSENISISPILLKESKSDTDCESPTHVHNPEGIDNISDDTNEPNLEHNWRNKNTGQTKKKKTYLDICPDWDIGNLKNIRIGIANLQNDNICPIISINKKRVIITNVVSIASLALLHAHVLIHFIKLLSKHPTLI